MTEVTGTPGLRQHEVVISVCTRVLLTGFHDLSMEGPTLRDSEHYQLAAYSQVNGRAGI
eukprot:SAG31_NODE_29829_length_389_cov_0.875862_1_plen_58_part_01